MNKTKTGKIKVVVYAIAKNEEKFAERWARSMSEADEVVVMDTGSTDRTMDILARHGVKVTRRLVRPWRFDTARNMSMDLIPADADICITTDLDEYFTGTGWADKLRRAAERNPHANLFDFDFEIKDHGRWVVCEEKFPAHRPEGLKWKYRVHEEMEFSHPPCAVFVNGITLRHTQEHKKTRRYRELLEAGMQENPCSHHAMYLVGELLGSGESGAEWRALRLCSAVLTGKIGGDVRFSRMIAAARRAIDILHRLPCNDKVAHYGRKALWRFSRMMAMPFLALGIRRGLWSDVLSALEESDDDKFCAKVQSLGTKCGYSSLSNVKDRNRLETELGFSLRVNH